MDKTFAKQFFELKIHLRRLQNFWNFELTNKTIIDSQIVEVDLEILNLSDLYDLCTTLLKESIENKE